MSLYHFCHTVGAIMVGIVILLIYTIILCVLQNHVSNTANDFKGFVEVF